MTNKAHTATARRIARLYDANLHNDDGIDVVRGSLLIAVETSATLLAGLNRLQSCVGQRYLAVTNKEALLEALELTANTPIGVMDPHGKIMKEAASDGDGQTAPAGGC